MRERKQQRDIKSGIQVEIDMVCKSKIKKETEKTERVRGKKKK